MGLNFAHQGKKLNAHFLDESKLVRKFQVNLTISLHFLTSYRIYRVELGKSSNSEPMEEVSSAFRRFQLNGWVIVLSWSTYDKRNSP